MTMTPQTLAFIGGGNMATALAGGMLRSGAPVQVLVLEPDAAQREKLAAQFPQIKLLPAADASLQEADLVVWAVKPQIFKSVAQELYAQGVLGPQALHLSVAAGIPSAAIAQWLRSEQIVRSMPNTPALVGKGMTGLYARPAVGAAARTQVEAVIAPSGQWLWVEKEPDLDAVTALSGSGPAYVFYFLEAMMAEGQALGLSAAQARQLAVATFAGAAELAAQSPESPSTLRERVTSKGGTTHAAITHMQAQDVGAHFQAALRACHARAAELAQEFGR